MSDARAAPPHPSTPSPPVRSCTPTPTARSSPPSCCTRSCLQAVRDRLDGPGVRVDVSSDGAGASTVTVRVLADDQARHLVAAAGAVRRGAARPVRRRRPDGAARGRRRRAGSPGFWAQAVDCEQLAAELQLPVADLAEALRGRLTPWLAEDLELLLHDDAHDRAADASPAQIVADAVLAHYRGDLDAADASTRLVQALVYAPEPSQLEIGARLCAALGDRGPDGRAGAGRGRARRPRPVRGGGAAPARRAARRLSPPAPRPRPRSRWTSCSPPPDRDEASAPRCG